MKRDFCPFDKKSFWSYLALLLTIAVLHKLTGGASFVAFAAVAVISVMTGKREQSFFWILTIVTVLVANQNLMPKGFIFTVTHRVTLTLFGFIGMMRMLGKRKSRHISPLLWLMPYLAFIIIPSALGWMPLISGLKLFLFTMVYLGNFAIANDVAFSNKTDIRKLRAIMLVFACFFIFGSLVMTRFPGLGMMNPIEAERQGLNSVTLFMGMTMHPQCLGPTIASITAIVYCDMLFGVKRAHPLYIALLAVAPYIVYLTSSRTGMGTFLCGLMFASWMFMRSRGMGLTNNWKSRVTSGIMTTIAILAVVVLAVPKVQQGILKYTLKWGAGESTFADFSMKRVLATRQGLIDQAIANFKESPLIGNGFQVSEDMQYLDIQDWRQLLSAPIEKGVWLAAILEEGGVIGMGLFLVFILHVFSSMKRTQTYSALTCLAVMLLSNLGEFTMFSPSYTGGFQVSMLFIAATLDAVRIRQMNDAARRMVYVQNIPVGYYRQRIV